MNNIMNNIPYDLIQCLNMRHIICIRSLCYGMSKEIYNYNGKSYNKLILGNNYILPNFIDIKLLNYAAVNCHIDIIKYLYDQSLLDSIDDMLLCNYAFTHAAYCGNLEIVMWLKEHGIIIDVIESYYKLAFHDAANNGHLNIIK